MTNLDNRIAGAFNGGVAAADIPALIREVEVAAVAAGAAAEQARLKALDPLTENLDAARRQMNDAAFARDRLQTALPKLKQRLKDLRDDVEDARRRALYDKLAAERDSLAAELREAYPSFAEKIADILSRCAANDREIEYLNGHMLPRDAQPLLLADQVARDLDHYCARRDFSGHS